LYARSQPGYVHACRREGGKGSQVGSTTLEGRRVYCGGNDGYRVLLGAAVGSGDGAVGGGV
jgi:hypothetical protein